MVPLAFVDVETTHLDAETGEVWEIAVIRRTADGVETEHLWQIRPTNYHLREYADPESLRIGRYHERIAVKASEEAAELRTDTGEPIPMRLADVVRSVHTVLDRAVMVGSNPGFDAGFLRVLLGAAPWHYRTIDIATRTEGYLIGSGRGDEVTWPLSSRALSRAVGVEPPGPDTAHTALGDARWAMSVYDAVTGGVPRRGVADRA